MTVHKRKKNVNYRGSKTHGCGSMKKRRGAGHRGGRGNAGTGKRGDVKKPYIAIAKKYFGKHGFSSKSAEPVRSINIKTIDDNCASWVKKGFITAKGDMFSINLAVIGCNKLLATGTPTRKYTITTIYASPSAIEKIEKAGGKVAMPTEAVQQEPAEKKEDNAADA